MSGGAVFPPVQGAIADKWNTRVSFFLVVPCFAYILCWAIWVWNQDGRQFRTRGQHHNEQPRENRLEDGKLGELEVETDMVDVVDEYDTKGPVHKI